MHLIYTKHAKNPFCLVCHDNPSESNYLSLQHLALLRSAHNTSICAMCAAATPMTAPEAPTVTSFGDHNAESNVPENPERRNTIQKRMNTHFCSR